MIILFHLIIFYFVTLVVIFLRNLFFSNDKQKQSGSGGGKRIVEEELVGVEEVKPIIRICFMRNESIFNLEKERKPYCGPIRSWLCYSCWTIANQPMQMFQVQWNNVLISVELASCKFGEVSVSVSLCTCYFEGPWNKYVSCKCIGEKGLIAISYNWYYFSCSHLKPQIQNFQVIF